MDGGRYREIGWFDWKWWVFVDAWSTLQVLCITVNNMYVRIVGSWANHCEHKIIIPSTAEQSRVAFGCWLMADDGSFIVVTRPCCFLSFRLLRAANLWWHEVNDRRKIQYNGMLLQWICPAIRAHRLMNGMVECLKEGEALTMYSTRAHGPSATA